jgi:hypothetical protein
MAIRYEYPENPRATDYRAAIDTDTGQRTSEWKCEVCGKWGTWDEIVRLGPWCLDHVPADYDENKGKGNCENCGRFDYVYAFDEGQSYLTDADDPIAVMWCERCVMGTEYPGGEYCGGGCSVKLFEDEIVKRIDDEPWCANCLAIHERLESYPHRRRDDGGKEYCCSGCGEWIEERESYWATDDGDRGVLRGRPWCEKCLPDLQSESGEK